MGEHGIHRVENGELKPYWKSEYKSNSIFNNYFIGRQYDEDTNIYSIALYNRIAQNMIWRGNYYDDRSIITVCDSLFLADWFKNPTYIENINIQTGKVMWRVDFEQKGCGKILKHKETLIVPLKNDHLLGLNTETGEKLWELEDCFNYQMLDEKTGLLYGYGAERYEIIDAAKGEKVLSKQFTGSMDKYKIFVSQHMSTLHGDGIYFTSNGSVIKFGKINIKTHEIEFVQELKEDKERTGRANASKPVYHNGRLYIKDSVGVLHIFEEE
jgi:outer membrane protein assembly factor BamB